MLFAPYFAPKVRFWVGTQLSHQESVAAMKTAERNVSARFVVSGCIAPEAFEPTEHTFDPVSLPVGLVPVLACGASRAHRFAAALGEPVAEFEDIVLWWPGFFEIKPELAIKRGFIVWSAMGDSAASLMTCEPILMRPQWGAFGEAGKALSACFVNQRRQTWTGKCRPGCARREKIQQVSDVAQRCLSRCKGQSQHLRGLCGRRLESRQGSCR